MSRKIREARKQGFSIIISVTNFAKNGDRFTIEKQGDNILLKKVEETINVT